MQEAEVTWQDGIENRKRSDSLRFAPNNLFHLTAARLWFRLNAKSLIWAAAGDQ
jgi:hypothetical protein